MKILSSFSLGICLVSHLSTGSWAADKAHAMIKGTAPDSQIRGTVDFEETNAGLKITAKIENAPPGNHGFHIHEFGDCGDTGKNAGSHYNPSGHPHGNTVKDGVKKTHAGDLGNVEINAVGTGSVDAVIKGLTIGSGKYFVAGRAVVLHEKMDDFSQPTGNAGGRIGCGLILIIKAE